MKNHEVARAFIVNALAYLDSDMKSVVRNNLELIQKLLEKPMEENEDYDWENFK